MGTLPGRDGRGQPPVCWGWGEGEKVGVRAVAEPRLAQLFRRIFLLLLRLLGNPVSPSQNVPRAASVPTAVSLRGNLLAGSFPKALGTLCPGNTVKRLYGEQFNLCCEVSGCRLGRLWWWGLRRVLRGRKSGGR